MLLYLLKLSAFKCPSSFFNQFSDDDDDDDDDELFLW